ncbi:MAG: HEPN domain-containing protein [Deltaproteobacteria bacterium]|nr:HEPN domain-containing protein [Deltaproteobacteria bacterium]
MKSEEIQILVKHRLEQAQTALDDAKYMIDGKRSAQSIVNRSYYAMFYAVLALLQKISKVPSKHSGVISLFDKEFVKMGIFEKDLSKDLHKAFELRQTIDYKIIEPIKSDRAEEIWNKAVRFVQKLEHYLTGEKPVS